LKVWSLQFSLIKLGLLFFSISFLAAQSSRDLALSSNALGEILDASGALKVEHSTTFENQETRLIFHESKVTLDDKALAHVFFRPGSYLKSRENTQFEIRKVRGAPMMVSNLISGTMFFHQRDKFWEWENRTALGIVRAKGADYLIQLLPEEQLLTVYCTRGRILFEFDALEFSLSAGEKIQVQRDRVKPKEEITGREIRFLYSWYRDSGTWTIPPLISQWKDLSTPKNPTISDLRINGLTMEEFENFQTFSAGDLVLGRVRLEGKIQNKLPHQILQLSLDGGENFFDVGRDDDFLYKEVPVEKEYEVIFRLRDLDRFYDVVHSPIEFQYRRMGNLDLAHFWRREVERFYMMKDASSLYELLKGSRTFSTGFQEDLRQEFMMTNSQKLNMEIFRLREYNSQLIADFKWIRVLHLTSSQEAVRQEGRVQVIFSIDPRRGVLPRHFSGDLPFLHGYSSRVDRRGPMVQGNSFANKNVNAPSLIPLVVEDDLSEIAYVEFFVDRVGRKGTGQRILSLDGQEDERRENYQIVLPSNSRAQRLFIHAKDRQGNWGFPFSVTLN